MAKKKDQAARARVLGGFTLDGVQYNPDDIIETDPKLIEQLGTSVDAHPDAVAHCLGLDKPVIKQHTFQSVEQTSGTDLADPTGTTNPTDPANPAVTTDPTDPTAE